MINEEKKILYKDLEYFCIPGILNKKIAYKNENLKWKMVEREEIFSKCLEEYYNSDEYINKINKIKEFETKFIVRNEKNVFFDFIKSSLSDIQILREIFNPIFKNSFCKEINLKKSNEIFLSKEGIKINSNNYKWKDYQFEFNKFENFLILDKDGKIILRVYLYSISKPNLFVFLLNYYGQIFSDKH